MRAVLDANVLISAALSSQGPSATLLRRCRDGALEVLASERLLEEFERAFTYPKLRDRVPAEKSTSYLAWLREHTTLTADPKVASPVTSPDPDDNYLLALAIAERAFLVTGDQHLLGLSDQLPIYRPAAFLRRLDQEA